MIYTEEQWEKIKQASPHFESAKHNYIRNAPRWLTTQVIDTYEGATGKKIIHRDLTCATCVLRVYQIIGKTYFQDKLEREKNFQDKLEREQDFQDKIEREKQLCSSSTNNDEHLCSSSTNNDEHLCSSSTNNVKLIENEKVNETANGKSKSRKPKKDNRDS